MKSKVITTLLASIGLFAAAGAAQAQTAGERVYVIDQRGEVVMSGAGLCWRTGFWTPAAAAKDPAGCKCDKDLLPKEVCEPMVAKAAPAAAPAAKPSGDKITVAADALFDFNKATLRPAGKAKLDEVVAKAGAIKLEVIIAVGHTDRIGSDAYNQKLSERRAAAVKQYLVSKGIDANRVYTEGKGKKNPVTKPDQCLGKTSPKVIACLQPDRRVDIELIGTK
ncbi:outer membrane protein OmpA [Accumulibacter sp.]|uniref:outer membrane protein OmpA n=1 Tax=Accumulibacter sp. TaxID=2053492 RepID=UPI00260310C4|nr:OmpA family protein [Accumulibacter sp.]